MVIPDPARWKLERQVNLRRQDRWPQLRDVRIRYRANFAYITATTDDGPLQLCRLRYIGSPDEWGFACYLASKDGYEDSILPTGSFTGTPDQALDCACGLYLNDPSAWWDARDTPQHDSRENL